MLRVSGTGTGRLVLTAGKFRNNGTNFYNFKGNRVTLRYPKVGLYCSEAESRVPCGVVGGGGGWCKPIIMSNPQPSYFVLLLGWVAVAWLGFGVMTIFKL